MARDLQWRRTGAPAASRTDDIWFFDAQRGWAVNANGHVLQTTDGGDTWERRFAAAEGTYLRCIGFDGDQRGWVGTLSASQRLLETRDGGATWRLVANLPPQAPPAICGLSVVDGVVAYGSGTNFPHRPTGIIKTVDGGDTWTGIDMNEHATLLVDILFTDAHRGWVVGGKADVPNPTRDDVLPVVLFTDDGGATWANRLAGIQPSLPNGEWGWKIQFLSADIGFVSLENFDDGAILKTVDGGRKWTRKAVSDPQGNANLEGIGFVDDQHGWTGGWGNRNFDGGFTSETHDGGETWADANHVGRFLNRFRFIREPELVGYASGDIVYKYAKPVGPVPRSVQPARAPPSPTRLPIRIPVDLASDEGTRVDIWDRFGEHVASPRPEPAGEEIVWSGETASGAQAPPGIYIMRVASDGDAESRTLYL